MEGQDLSNEIQNGADDQQESKLSFKLSEAQKHCNLERKILCSSIPGAELSDKEFRRLFFRSACQPDLAVNDTRISSLKLSDAKIEELQNRADQLEATNISVQQHHSTELDQSTETLRFYQFNNELCLKIADLEEPNKQLQESFEMINSACERLIGEKQQLTSVVQFVWKIWTHTNKGWMGQLHPHGPVQFYILRHTPSPLIC